jgi:UDP-N-acetylglucosamine 2-epimerase
MIHIFIGTKAQFIKMAPIMLNLNNRGIPYTFIDSGQHAKTVNDLILQFGLKKPDVSLSGDGKNITTVYKGLSWAIHSISQAILTPKYAFKKIFGNKKGICLVHGDTLSTLIALFYAKRCGLKVAHIEAGLRSHKIFDPFPEEIVRLIAMRFSDLLFAPSKWAFENLCKMGLKDKAINVAANTGLEAVQYAVKQGRATNSQHSPYTVVTIHRIETIFSRSRMVMVIDLIKQIQKKHKVKFVLHEPTRQQLQKFDLLSTLTQNPGIEVISLLPYLEFVNLIEGADFVITDGGSIQEECYYLNKPCLIMRSKTERMEGLGENAMLSRFDLKRIRRFLQIYPKLRQKSLQEILQPSTEIIEHLLPWI